MIPLALLLLGACSAKTTSATPTPAETASATPAPATTSAPIVDSRVVIFSCAKTADVAPDTIVFACADAGAGLKRLTWRDWGAPSAVGTGLRYQNDCVPYCARGHFHNYPARAVAYGRGIVDGRRAYTRLDVTVFGAHPSYIKNPERYILADNGPRGPQ